MSDNQVSSVDKTYFIRISRNQFLPRIMNYRSPYAACMIKETDWFRVKGFNLLCFIAMDLIDNDFYAMVMAPNKFGQYAPLVFNCNFAKKQDAMKWMAGAIKKKILTNDFDVEAPDHNYLDLFAVKVSQDKLNPSFWFLSNQPGYGSAKELLISLLSDFNDQDGNFVKDFQSTGFDSRMWEIYLTYFFKENDFVINHPSNRPDFCLEKYGFELFVEAVTVGRNKENPRKLLIEHESDETIRKHNYTNEEMALRFGSSLYSKKQKNYPQLEHVKGKPFAIAIADFYEEFSMQASYNAILEYLYGYSYSHYFEADGELHVVPKDVKPYKKGNVEIESGFFNQEGNEEISGIFFSNSGTISKFLRVGSSSGYGEKDTIIEQFGVKYHHDPNATKPDYFRRTFSYWKGSEAWSEGMNLYHNPNANYPIPVELFPEIAHHNFVEGKFQSILPDFYPYWSTTIIKRKKD